MTTRPITRIATAAELGPLLDTLAAAGARTRIIGTAGDGIPLLGVEGIELADLETMVLVAGIEADTWAVEGRERDVPCSLCLGPTWEVSGVCVLCQARDELALAADDGCVEGCEPDAIPGGRHRPPCPTAELIADARAALDDAR